LSLAEYACYFLVEGAAAGDFLFYKKVLDFAAYTDSLSLEELHVELGGLSAKKYIKKVAKIPQCAISCHNPTGAFRINYSIV
jgi:hypothetical protein